MLIRAATEHDWPAMAEIYGQIRRDDFVWLAAEARAEGDLRAQTAGEHLFVAVDGAQVAGFISVWPAESFVHHLYIAKPYQGRGIGTALLAHVQLRYPFPFRLKCAEKNERALRFYQHRGWRAVETGVGEEGRYLHLELAESPLTITAQAVHEPRSR